MKIKCKILLVFQLIMISVLFLTLDYQSGIIAEKNKTIQELQLTLYSDLDFIDVIPDDADTVDSLIHPPDEDIYIATFPGIDKWEDYK